MFVRELVIVDEKSFKLKLHPCTELPKMWEGLTNRRRAFWRRARSKNGRVHFLFIICWNVVHVCG